RGADRNHGESEPLIGSVRAAEDFGALPVLVAAPRAVAMHHFMVMMDAAMMDLVMPIRCRVMPMLCPVLRMAGERLARTMPEPLPVAQTAAPALRLARRARGAVVGVPNAAMGVRGAA